MHECPYLRKNGKKCRNKLSDSEVLCSKHGGKGKNQKGGFLYELIYPMGASVGMATLALYKINNLVSDWYIDRRKKNNKHKT